MPKKTLDTLCADCQSADGSLTIRKRQLCPDCFARYLNSKALKRMESYRFKNLSADQKKRLFLPLSGGVSSLVLLHILDSQLQKQIVNRNRTAYDLVIAHVVLPSESLDDVSSEWYQRVSDRFSTHTYLPSVTIYEAFSFDDRLENDLKHFGLERHHGTRDTEFYAAVFNSTTSVTTRTDLQELLLKRMLVAMAKQNQCESIVWGHSDSRLAAQALADVAKGRGGSVPSTIADGTSAHGINFNYPLRDLFRTELELYTEVVSDNLSSLINTSLEMKRPVASIRNTSIDDLLSNYINSQGEKYPSIMANVVRTASKLQVGAQGDGEAYCVVCRSPTSREDHLLCYGCARLKQDIRIPT